MKHLWITALWSSTFLLVNGNTTWPWRPTPAVTAQNPLILLQTLTWIRDSGYSWKHMDWKKTGWLWWLTLAGQQISLHQLEAKSTTSLSMGETGSVKCRLNVSMLLLANYWHFGFMFLSSCPNPKDPTVKVEGNGLGISNLFSFNTFQFTGSNGNVFLHCKVELCVKHGDNCVPVCIVYEYSNKNT